MRSQVASSLIRSLASACLRAKAYSRKLGDVAYRRPLLLQKQRCRVVNDGAGGKSSADKRPCRMRLVALMIERLCAFIRKLDRQRRDQGAGRKSQQTSERTF